MSSLPPITGAFVYSVPHSPTLSAQACRSMCLRSHSEGCTATSIETCLWRVIADLPTACDYANSLATLISPGPSIKLFDSLTTPVPVTLCHACADLSSDRTISSPCFAILVFYMVRGHPANTIPDGFIRDFPNYWCQPPLLHELSDPDIDPLQFGERHAFIGWP